MQYGNVKSDDKQMACVPKILASNENGITRSTRFFFTFALSITQPLLMVKRPGKSNRTIQDVLVRYLADPSNVYVVNNGGSITISCMSSSLKPDM